MIEATTDSASDEGATVMGGDRRTVWERVARLGAVRLGSIQVIIGLVVIWTVFALAHDRFLSPANLTNLALQVASVGIVSLGVVMVLLVAQIDLSVGSISGVTTALMVVLNINHGVPAALSLVFALVGGATIGLVHGLITTRFKVPALIVTLGGLITWQGLQLFLLGNTGSVNITDPLILGLTRTFFPPFVGWGIVVISLITLAIQAYRRRRSRVSLELDVPSVAMECGRIILLGAIMAAAVLIFSASRGVPLSVMILVGVVVVMDVVCRRTVFGRRLFAVGGNPQSAERVGISVRATIVAAFVLAGTFAALGGIMGASRLMAVNQSFGAGEVLLNAIAGAVIGGTSLFGGRGSAWSALLGALVIGSVSNGMDLLALESSVKLMITGVVLVAAVIIDAMTRRSPE